MYTGRSPRARNKPSSRARRRATAARQPTRSDRPTHSVRRRPFSASCTASSPLPGGGSVSAGSQMISGTTWACASRSRMPSSAWIPQGKSETRKTSPGRSARRCATCASPWAPPAWPGALAHSRSSRAMAWPAPRLCRAGSHRSLRSVASKANMPTGSPARKALCPSPSRKSAATCSLLARAPNCIEADTSTTACTGTLTRCRYTRTSQSCRGLRRLARRSMRRGSGLSNRRTCVANSCPGPRLRPRWEPGRNPAPRGGPGGGELGQGGPGAPVRLPPRGRGGGGDGVHDFLHQRVGQFRPAQFVHRREKHAMAQRRRQYRVNVFRHEVAATGHPCQHARGPHQRADAPGTGAGENQPPHVDAVPVDAERVGRLARLPQLQHIALDGGARLYAALYQRGDVVQLLPAQNRRLDLLQQGLGIVERRVENQRAAPGGGGGLADVQLEHEAVAGGRGQLEGLFFLDLVAVGEHRHMREMVLAVEGRHRALGHRPQQQRLHLWPGTVDFVEKKGAQLFAMAQQRARVDARPAVLIDIAVIDQIARHQVDAPFHALELTADGAGKGAQHRGLADADIAFEQHMAAREQRHIDQADDLRLADYRLGHLALHTPGATLPVLELLVCCHRILWGNNWHGNGAGDESRACAQGLPIDPHASHLHETCHGRAPPRKKLGKMAPRQSAKQAMCCTSGGSTLVLP